MSQICAQGKNMSQLVVKSDSWQMVPFTEGTRFPTFGYETSTPGAPLTFEVDTTVGGVRGGTPGVIITHTKAQSGLGTATVRWAGLGGRVR